MNRKMSIDEAFRVLQDVRKKYPLTLGLGQYHPDKCRRGGENNDEQYDDAA